MSLQGLARGLQSLGASSVASNTPTPPPAPVPIGEWDTTASHDLLASTLGPVDGVTVSDFAPGPGYVSGGASFYSRLDGLVRELSGATPGSHAAAYAANQWFGCTIDPGTTDTTLDTFDLVTLLQEYAGVTNTVAVWLNGVNVWTSGNLTYADFISPPQSVDLSGTGVLPGVSTLRVTVMPCSEYFVAGCGAAPGQPATLGLTAVVVP